MAQETPEELTFSLSALAAEPCAPEPAEEQATFGLLTVTANGRPLTAIEDGREFRRGPHLAGYPLAEWLLWNRWRLRWEFARASRDEAAREWDFAHRMAAIGGGYAWPNITIFSDGLLSFLVSEPSPEPETVLFSYAGAARPEAVPAAALEAAIDGFARDILARLDERELKDTNLRRLWNDLEAERRDPERARFRRLEAQLGCDPDEAGEDAIRGHLSGADRFGDEAWGEMAADAALRGRALDDMVSVQGVAEVAERRGFDADPNDAVALPEGAGLPGAGEAQAWRLGYGMARAVRDREGLDGLPLADERLAAMAGTTPEAVARTNRRWDGPCFALDRADGGGRLALRSKWKTGRRFELARLLGDRLFAAHDGRHGETLFPATRTYSYRQKAQRAFAAELLSPFAAVDDMMAGDLSEDRQMEAARRFGVSPMTVRAQLVSHGRLDREDAPDIGTRGGGW